MGVVAGIFGDIEDPVVAAGQNEQGPAIRTYHRSYRIAHRPALSLEEIGIERKIRVERLEPRTGGARGVICRFIFGKLCAGADPVCAIAPEVIAPKVKTTAARRTTTRKFLSIWATSSIRIRPAA